MIWGMPTGTLFIILLSILSGSFPFILYLLWKGKKSADMN